MDWPTVLQSIGNTPLVRLQRVPGPNCATIMAKLEGLNPTGSVKDRIALAMVENAETNGVLKPGYTIVEPTSGNMGVALAMVCAAKKYRLVITMPGSTPTERRLSLSRYGVKLLLTEARYGMDGSIHMAKELATKDSSTIHLDQFRNQANVLAHRSTTAQEVLHQTNGCAHAFVAGVGTGGTLTGVGEVLKQHSNSILIVAVEPTGSPLLRLGLAGHHTIAGIGPDFIPPLLNRKVVDEVIGVTDKAAEEMAQQLSIEEGLLVGPSSGANVVAALEIGRRLGSGKLVVTILPDNGKR